MDMEITSDCEGCGGRGRVPFDEDEPDSISRIPCGLCLRRYTETHCARCHDRLGATVVMLRTYHGDHEAAAERCCSRACAQAIADRAPTHRIDGDPAPVDCAAALATARRELARLTWCVRHWRDEDAYASIAPGAVIAWATSLGWTTHPPLEGWVETCATLRKPTADPDTTWCVIVGDHACHSRGAVQTIACCERIPDVLALAALLPPGPWDAP